MGNTLAGRPTGQRTARRGIAHDVSTRYDVAVVGAGFGGLSAALTLAERGARVVLFEALRYPGGCASTFTRKGYSFEAGATLFSGFAPGQPFDRWVRRHAMPVSLETPDPVVELRTGHMTLGVPPSREAFVARVSALPGAPVARVRDFFDEQRRVADALWALFDDPTLLPPLDARTLLAHVARTPAYLAVLPHVGRPLAAALERHGLASFAPLRAYLDAVCQITVQASSSEAEAPFAMGAMDYYFRGARHVRGGIGSLATAMVDAIKRLGGDVRMPAAVRSLRRRSGVWAIASRADTVEADHVVANLLPHGITRLLAAGADAVEPLDAAFERDRERAAKPLGRLAARVETGWGAAMLYLALAPGAIAQRPEAHHLELIDDAAAPFVEGNHVFVSISAADERRGPAGERTVTASTHIPMTRLLSEDDRGKARYVAQVQARMAATIALRAPEIVAAEVFRMTASPRTFARFTGRHEGFVGGVPRRAGLHNYEGLLGEQPAPGLHLVGDSVFPGQSTLAVALGGLRVAERIGRASARAPASALGAAARSW